MNSSHEALLTRKPAVAGQFYPGNSNELRNELRRLFALIAPKPIDGNILAVISPHAGYVFSGPVAAAAFMEINAEKQYENIFVIGSSHRYAFDGASVYTRGNYTTPLGIVPVNIKLSHELMSVYNFYTDRSEVQDNEHSLEVQLPFLQYRLKKPFQIVPIVISTQQAPTCKKIADSLLSYLTPSNLFIISTDFSHYPG
jgi:AmmeMemoRadiSam system protein B